MKKLLCGALLLLMLLPLLGCSGEKTVQLKVLYSTWAQVQGRWCYRLFGVKPDERGETFYRVVIDDELYPQCPKTGEVLDVTYTGEPEQTGACRQLQAAGVRFVRQAPSYFNLFLGPMQGGASQVKSECAGNQARVICDLSGVSLFTPAEKAAAFAIAREESGIEVREGTRAALKLQGGSDRFGNTLSPLVVILSNRPRTDNGAFYYSKILYKSPVNAFYYLDQKWELIDGEWVMTAKGRGGIA